MPMWLKSPEFHKAVVERLIAELYRGRRCVGQVWLIFRNRTPWVRQRKRTDRSDIYRNCLGKQRCVQKQLVLAYIDTILIVKGIVHQKKKKWKFGHHYSPSCHSTPVWLFSSVKHTIRIIWRLYWFIFKPRTIRFTESVKQLRMWSVWFLNESCRRICRLFWPIHLERINSKETFNHEIKRFWRSLHWFIFEQLNQESLDSLSQSNSWESLIRKLFTLNESAQKNDLFMNQTFSSSTQWINDSISAF